MALKLDDIDYKILSILEKKGKISNLELSKYLGLSPSPCLRRVKKLEESGVIKGYYAYLDSQMLGFHKIYFASTLLNVDEDKENRIENFINALNEISEVKEVYSLVEDNEFLVKIITKDYLSYKYILVNKIAKIPFIKKIKIAKISKQLKKTNTLL